MSTPLDLFELDLSAVLPGFVFICIVALCVGSFIGVAIARLPEGRSIVWQRSTCPHCAQRLALRDLIPLASWCARMGRCRYCAHRLSWFYPAVEIAAAAVCASALVALRGQPLATLAVSLILGWSLLTAAWIDARMMILPDVITLPLVLAGLLVAWWFDRPMIDHAAGAIAGFLVLVTVAKLYRGLRGREGMGLGDAKLTAAAGAWLGWQALPTVLLIGSLAGLLTAATLAAYRGADLSDLKIPFGPALALAFWWTWLAGPLFAA